MISILSSQQIKQVDQFTIEHEPVSSLLLMERAAHKCYNLLIEKFDKESPFRFFCGLGNNGGDGIAIARMLYNAGYTVSVCVIRYSDKTSSDFAENEKRLVQIDNALLVNITDEKNIPAINENEIVIDCIFGTGLSRPPEGLVAGVIREINKSSATIVSIDLPSGLYGDESSVAHKDVIVNADCTLTFQLPKLAFMFPENAKHVGELIVLNIGLSQHFIESQPTKNFIPQKEDISRLLKPRKQFSHKGIFGHALIISGSYGKMGAAVLSAKACLRSGAGLLSVNVPKCGYEILQSSFPEAMIIADEEEKFIATQIDYGKFNAVGIGPGIGTNEATQKVVKWLIQNYPAPIIFDADAINILSENKTWLAFLAPGCIITPHAREFERLVGKSSNDFERNKMQIEFSIKNKCYIILKGKNSCISTPAGQCFFNPTGNPGMSTAGSGDVLTGILTGLLAQGYSSFETCLMGVYVHGLAGDCALKNQSPESLIASDIVENLGEAFKELGPYFPAKNVSRKYLHYSL